LLSSLKVFESGGLSVLKERVKLLRWHNIDLFYFLKQR